MGEIWVAAAVTVGGAVLSGVASSSAAKKQAQASKDQNEVNFQQQAWLAQQQRLYQQEDKRAMQDKVGAFAAYAPDSAKTFNGVAVTRPDKVNPASGLMDFDPNQVNSMPAGGYFSKIAGAYGDTNGNPVISAPPPDPQQQQSKGGGGGILSKIDPIGSKILGLF